MDTSFARPWLRLEGLATFIIAGLLYWHFHLNGFWFAVLFLAPDLSMLGYLAGPRFGATLYNLGHNHLAAGIVLAAGLIADITGAPRLALLGIGLIWCAHIGFDRALGYGLKSPESFRLTHLGKIGRDHAPKS